MWTCFPCNRHWRCWPVMISRAVVPVALLALAGCSALPGLGEDPLKAELEARLASEPAACADYRAAYVAGFETHVQGLSVDQQALTQQGLERLASSRAILAASGLERADCTRPHCIIEPLDAGKLDSWCGYRLDRSDGPEVFQWFEWSTVENE